MNAFDADYDYDGNAFLKKVTIIILILQNNTSKTAMPALS